MELKFSKDTYSITKEQSQMILAIIGEMPLKTAIHLNNYFINILSEQEELKESKNVNNQKAK